MAKQQIPKSKSDTTKIPTPYKVSKKELDFKNTINNSRGAVTGFKPNSDTTAKKIIYNMNNVSNAVNKRNMERVSEGKAPISKTSVFGVKKGDVRESVKGKTFKESPLKSVPKKKK